MCVPQTSLLLNKSPWSVIKQTSDIIWVLCNKLTSVWAPTKNCSLAEFSGPYGATKYGSGWRNDVVNQCLEFATNPRYWLHGRPIHVNARASWSGLAHDRSQPVFWVLPAAALSVMGPASQAKTVACTWQLSDPLMRPPDRYRCRLLLVQTHRCHLPVSRRLACRWLEHVGSSVTNQNHSTPMSSWLSISSSSFSRPVNLWIIKQAQRHKILRSQTRTGQTRKKPGGGGGGGGGGQL